VGDWWSCRWSPVASQGAPPAAVRETHKAILWGGGGWPQPSRWRLPRTGGGEGVGSAVGWCRRRSLTLAPELRPRRGGVALGASTRRCR
jgi:hypothetical protein